MCQQDATLSEPCPYKRQALTSLDHSTASWLSHFLTGGLNLQSIHHCMPGVSLVHYPAMYPAFRAVCEKHGCAPTVVGSIGRAIAYHWRYVYDLGGGHLASDIKPAPEEATMTRSSNKKKTAPSSSSAPSTRGTRLGRAPSPSAVPVSV